MVMKILKRGTTLSIRTSPYSKLISNENSEKFYISNLIEFLFGTSILSEIWTKGLCLPLVSNSIHGEEFEVHTRNLGTWI
jgi:hypothetical protein